MLEPLAQLAIGWLVLAAMMAALWLVQRRTGNAAVVDVGWTYGIGFLALLFALTSPGDGVRRAVLALIAVSWSLRLGTHLLRGRVLSRDGEPQVEEGRYQKLRESWGEHSQRNLFLFFQAQALGALLFGLPFLVVARSPAAGLDGWVIAAVALWLVAVAGETVADRQLERFKSDPASRGRTMRRGLWRYSRHPNYFFEWLHWWCYVLLAVGAPYFWVSLIGPAVMLLLLFRVTGIPTTEAQAVRSRADYRDYQRTTSAFVPWFPREESA